MYGVSPDERVSGTPQANSSFMGRVLISLHITENERPSFHIANTQGCHEPPTQTYHLWFDLYDLINCDELLSWNSVWATASIG